MSGFDQLIRPLILAFWIWLAGPTIGLASSDKDIWLASKRGQTDVASMSAPNIAVRLPREETRRFTASALSIETSDLVVQTSVEKVDIGLQTVDATSRFSVLIPSSKSGLPFSLRVLGSADFSVALTFGGSTFAFLPRVSSVQLQRVIIVESGAEIPVPGGLEARIPEWLHEAVISYLNSRGLLQLPVELATNFPLTAEATSSSVDLSSAVTVSKPRVSVDLWVEAAAILIDADGIIGLAQASMDLTFPRCNSDNQPRSADVRFTRHDADSPLSEIPPDETGLMFRGRLIGPTEGKYGVAWRMYGVTLGEHPIAVDTSGQFSVALALPRSAAGLYSAIITVKTSDDTLCIVSSHSIVRLRDLPVTIPEPVTRQMALDEFAAYSDDFRNLMQRVGLPLKLGSLSLSVLKPLIAQSLENIFNGVDISADIDASRLPPERLRGAKIKVPKPDEISCTPTRNCEPQRNCDLSDNCRFDEDRRNCRRKAPWGGHVNDPFCESGKALENARRKALYAQCKVEEGLAKLDCERIKSQEKLSCEIEKASEKALCETLKEAVGLLAPDQNLASVNGDFKFNGSATVVLVELEVDDLLRDYEVKFKAGAHVKTEANIEFVPENVGGHLLCISKWKAPISISANLSYQDYLVSAGLEIDHSRNQLGLKLNIPELQLKFSPAPFIAMFGQNPWLVSVCPLIFAAGIGEGVYDQLDANYRSTLWTGDFKIEPMEIAYRLEVPGLQLPGGFGFPARILAMVDDGRALTWQ